MQQGPSTAFAVGIEKDGSSVVVTCSGDLDITSSERLQDVFDQIISDGTSSIVVDCRNVPFVDSTGIRRLLQFSRDCEQAEVDLLVLASEQLRKVAAVLGVSEAVRIDDPSSGPSPS